MKLREIERLRGVAILMVMCIHSPPICELLPVQIAEMWSGVDLFFVISGYVVSMSFARLSPRVGRRR
jgi:peptidoglycan/LPS O-acetylase OafA/YrhL